MRRWKPSGAWQLARLRWPSGQPRKAAEIGILLALLERMNPADGADGAGRVRNHELAARATSPEVLAILADRGLEAGQVGAAVVTLADLADAAGASIPIVRRVVRRAREAGLIDHVGAHGLPDLYLWNDARLAELDSRVGVVSDTYKNQHLQEPAPTVSDTREVSEPPPTRVQETPPSHARVEDPRASGPSGHHDHDPRPDGRGPRATPEQFRELDELWGSGFNRARRGRGLFGFNGAEQHVLSVILEAHGFEAVREAMRAEILRAGQHERGPRLDWVRDALEGKAPPQGRRGQATMTNGRRPASPMPKRDRWRSPTTRGE